MKFDRIIGKCDPNIILETEEKLSSVFTELATGYEAKLFGSKLGGDIFLHQMISPLKHICDTRALEFEQRLNKLKEKFAESELSIQEQKALIEELKLSFGKKLLYTASTNGKEYFWYPPFILGKSKIGLRLVVGHEGWHSIYMHPSRRGSRNKSLWNISVDFKVNYTQIEDLKARGIYNPTEVFRKELGDFITLQEYAAFLDNPFNPPSKLEKWNPMYSLQQMLDSSFQNIDDKNIKSFYYAEPNLTHDLKQPEAIYQFLLGKIPKCKTCGKMGVWKKPQEFKELEKQVYKNLGYETTGCDDH